MSRNYSRGFCLLVLSGLYPPSSLKDGCPAEKLDLQKRKANRAMAQGGGASPSTFSPPPKWIAIKIPVTAPTIVSHINAKQPMLRARFPPGEMIKTARFALDSINCTRLFGGACDGMVDFDQEKRIGHRVGKSRELEVDIVNSSRYLAIDVKLSEVTSRPPESFYSQRTCPVA